MLKIFSESWTSYTFQKYFYFFIIAVSFLLFYKLGSWGVIETSEARYAEIAREMFLSGDFIHPRLLGILHYHKPPFIYWITTLSYSLFGTTEFAARFFLQVAYLLQIYLVYKISRLMLQSHYASLFAAVIYATMPMVLISIRGLTTDAYVNTMILAAIYTWLSFITSKKIIYIYSTSLLLALGFLTKGPVPWIYVGLFIIGTVDMTGNLKKYWPHYLIAIIILIPLSLSWYWVIIHENAQLGDYFLIHHTIERFTNASTFKRAEPWWYYLAVSPAVMLTWLLVFIAGIIKNKLTTMPVILKRVTLFWILIPFVFFSTASSKLVLYILPIFGGVSILCAYFLMRENFSKKIENSFLVVLIILDVAFLTTPFLSGEIVAPVWIVFIPLLALIILVTIHRKGNLLPRAERICLYAMTFTLSLIPVSTELMSNNEVTVNAIAPVANWIRSENLDKRSILVYNELMPSLAFQLRNHDIISLYDGNQNALREVDFERTNQWRTRWFDLTNEKTLAPDRRNSILVAKKGKIKEHSQWLLAGYTKQKTFGKWIVYY
jgi:4-amino-4-deoxy-L-arabinose transferase-like glycosyltransferase